MFGYICVNEQELKLREYTEYRSFYCGLCDTLHRRYGRSAQLVLNYDTTFLAILLTGLYEPDTQFPQKRCIPHPVRRHPMACNAAVSYAADMCVLLAYQKALDDWEDERKVTGRTLARLLRPGYQKLAQEYPRQTKAVEESIRLLHEAEQAGKADSLAAGQALQEIDYVAGLTGNFLGEIFVWKEDIWQDDLRQIGFYLGKFIYLMDALDDIEKDRKSNNYNVFAGDRDVWSGVRREEILGALTGMMTEAARAFERLPVLQYAPILRNILYSGVWCKYAWMQEADARNKQKAEEKRTKKRAG